MIPMAMMGPLFSGYSQGGQYDAEARVDEANARAVLSQANQREEQTRRETGLALGEQAAAVAQSGTGFGGSNALLMRQSGANAELDALNARYEGALQSTSYRNKALGERYAAKNARIGGWIGAGTAAMDTVAKAYSMGFGGGGGLGGASGGGAG
jgi:hypothetical protein